MLRKILSNATRTTVSRRPNDKNGKNNNRDSSRILVYPLFLEFIVGVVFQSQRPTKGRIRDSWRCKREVVYEFRAQLCRCTRSETGLARNYESSTRVGRNVEK